MTIISGPTEVVPANRAAPQDRWEASLKRAIRDPRELCRALGLSEQIVEQAAAAAGDFPLFVPREFLARIRPGDPDDPLLRQVLPQAAEAQSPPGFSPDPVGDLAAQRSPGLLMKYRRRALLVTTGACAVHCRYCFRRHFPYEAAPHSPRDWAGALAQIAADGDLREVILSGGDPWMLRDRSLRELTTQLCAIPHLKRLRIHTRLPVMIPSRVTYALLDILSESRLAVFVVVHINHPAEIDPAVEAALARLAAAGVVLLNQAVLLRGVNDDADILAELCERLVDLSVMPYYLHQLDRVLSAAHFETPIARGLEIMKQLRGRLPGYAVPRYVREVAGEASKVELF